MCRQALLVLLALLVSASAWPDWRDGLARIPNYKVSGSDYVAVTSYGESYIRYAAREAATRGVLREAALEIAGWCQIPEHKVLETGLYKGKPTLQIVFKPWHHPFDEVAPGKRPGSYRILIGLRGVVVQGRADEGLMNGVALLKHMLSHSAGMSLRRMVIDDLGPIELRDASARGSTDRRFAHLQSAPALSGRKTAANDNVKKGKVDEEEAGRLQQHAVPKPRG